MELARLKISLQFLATRDVSHIFLQYLSRRPYTLLTQQASKADVWHTRQQLRHKSTTEIWLRLLCNYGTSFFCVVLFRTSFYFKSAFPGGPYRPTTPASHSLFWFLALYKFVYLLTYLLTFCTRFWYRLRILITLLEEQTGMHVTNEYVIYYWSLIIVHFVIFCQ